MRVLPAALLCVFITFHAALGAGEPLKTGEGIDPPAQGFGKLSELFRWAATSSFGGGGITSYHLGDADVHVVTRSFTSGQPTAELSFYVLRQDTKMLTRVLHMPVRHVETRSRLDAETQAIVIEQYDYRKAAWTTAMTLGALCFEP